MKILDQLATPFIGAWKSCAAHEEVIEAARLLGNTIILAGLLTQKIPRVIPNTIVSLFAFQGILYVPAGTKNLLEIKKQYSQATNTGPALIYVIEGLRNATDIGLTIAGFGASLAGLLGNSPLETHIYKKMGPWAKTSLVVAFFMKFPYKRKIDEKNPNARKLDLILHIYRNSLLMILKFYPPKTVVGASINTFSSGVRLVQLMYEKRMT